MFDKQQWMQWAKDAKENNPQMKDFRNEYWHANNVQEQGVNNVDSLADAARQVMARNQPIEIDEGVGKAIATAAKNPIVQAGAAEVASQVANKIKASIAKKKAEKQEGAGEENRAKKVAEGEEVEENMSLAPKGKGKNAAKKLYANYGTYEAVTDDEENADEDDERKAGKEDDKQEGAGEENRAKGVKKESAEQIDEAAPLIGVAAKMAGRYALSKGAEVASNMFKKSKQGGEDGKEVVQASTEYPSKLKRKRMAMKKK